MLFKSLLLVVGFVAALQNLVLDGGEDEKRHCKPRCCGCNRKDAKSKVLRLTEIFDKLIVDANTLGLAFELTIPEAELYITSESCPLGGCCYASGSLALIAPILNDGEILNEIVDISEKCDGTILVNSTTVVAYPLAVPPKSLAYSLLTTWVPTEGCNYKIAKITGYSLACQFLVTLPCNQCPT